MWVTESEGNQSIGNVNKRADFCAACKLDLMAPWSPFYDCHKIAEIKHFKDKRSILAPAFQVSVHVPQLPCFSPVAGDLSWRTHVMEESHLTHDQVRKERTPPLPRFVSLWPRTSTRLSILKYLPPPPQNTITWGPTPGEFLSEIYPNYRRISNKYFQEGLQKKLKHRWYF